MTWMLGEKGMGSLKDHVDDTEDDVDVGGEGHGKPQGPRWRGVGNSRDHVDVEGDGEDNVDGEDGAWGAPETTSRTTMGAARMAARTAAGTTWTSGEKGVGSSTAAVPQ